MDVYNGNKTHGVRLFHLNFIFKTQVLVVGVIVAVAFDSDVVVVAVAELRKFQLLTFVGTVSGNDWIPSR